MNKSYSTTSIVLVALFAALTFIGTTIKIPLPTGAFIHLGNSVLLISVLLLGYKRGALAGGLGFALFDIFNGFAAEAPYFFIESFIVGGVAALVVCFFHHDINRVSKLVTIGIITGIAKLVMTQLKNTMMLVLSGADVSFAFLVALEKLPATIINVISTTIIVILVYFPLKKSLKLIFPQKVTY